MTDFYKNDGSYYTADTNTKIADLNALNALSKAGGKEVSYTPPPMSNQAGFGTYAQNRSVVSSDTLNAGLTAPSIKESLPSANTQAQLSYTQDTQVSAEKQLADLKATQLKEAEQARKQAETEYKTIQDEKQGKIDTYDSQMNPLADTARNEYSRMLGSLGNIDYNKLTSDRMSLTNDVVEYSKLMRQELDQEASRPALASVSQGRQNSIKENYTSKIATSQAALQAIDGNFSLAFDIMDKGANAINQLTTDRINFLNTIKGLYDSKEENAYNKILNLSADEKKLIERSITDLENKQKLVEENKKEIMKLMEDNPLIANKAGLLLTDTAEQRAEKLNKLYTKNPQYLPENQAWIKKAMDKYSDAGITPNDSLETIKSKIAKSRIYQVDTNKFSFETDDTGNTVIRDEVTGQVKSVGQTGTIGGQCGDYVHSIMTNTPKFGDTWQTKKAAMNITPEQFKITPQIGDIVTFKTNLPYGHVAVVTSIDGDNFTVTESNWNGDEKVTNGRVINLNDPNILGAYRGATFSNPGKTKKQLETEQKEAEMQKAKDNATQVKQTALDLIKDLRESPAINFATGLMSVWSNVPGTEAYYFAQRFNQLRDLLAMGNIDKLKGAMSDKDIEFLRNSATSLKLGLKSDAFKSELDKLQFKLNNPTSSIDEMTTTGDDPLNINNDPLGLN